MDGFVDDFIWRPYKKKYTKPWVGFIHCGINKPSNREDPVLSDLLIKPFLTSLPQCKQIFVLSNYLREHLMELSVFKHLCIPIEVLHHPKRVDSKFSINNFVNNPQIYHLGNHLRNFSDFFKFQTSFKKNMLLPNDSWVHKRIKTSANEVNMNLSEIEKENNVQYKTVPDIEYAKILANNIIYNNLYDSSANNLVVECIASETPLIINRLPALEEYLGFDYPLFTDVLPNNLDEKLLDPNFLIKMCNHLKSRQHLICLETFTNNFLSKIESIDLTAKV